MPELAQLTVGDATHGAYVRIPDGATAGVVVLHPWWGLNDDVIAYADRLADAGFAVEAPDMFSGRTATEPEEAEQLAEAGDQVADGIVLAAVDDLAGVLGEGARLAILGFSFGAGYAIWAPSEKPRLAASVVYYGAYAGEFLKRSTAPVLGHFAEDDPYTSEEEIRALEEGYRAAGRDAIVHRYPGTGHWFAEPSRDAYREDAAELAFRRTREFLADRLGPKP
jgi:carboxymethylenebutenolidase